MGFVTLCLDVVLPYRWSLREELGIPKTLVATFNFMPPSVILSMASYKVSFVHDPVFCRSRVPTSDLHVRMTCACFGTLPMPEAAASAGATPSPHPIAVAAPTPSPWCCDQSPWHHLPRADPAPQSPVCTLPPHSSEPAAVDAASIHQRRRQHYDLQCCRSHPCIVVGIGRSCKLSTLIHTCMVGSLTSRCMLEPLSRHIDQATVS